MFGVRRESEIHIILNGVYIILTVIHQNNEIQQNNQMPSQLKLKKRLGGGDTHIDGLFARLMMTKNHWLKIIDHRPAMCTYI